MNKRVTIPARVWYEVRDFFAQIVSPCRDCLRGNFTNCWQSRCAAFKFRPIARDVLAIKCDSTAPALPMYVQIEDEILEQLSRYTRPVPPSALRLTTTRSKAVKSKTISRLVRRGLVIEDRADNHTRYISLPTKRNPNNE